MEINMQTDPAFIDITPETNKEQTMEFLQPMYSINMDIKEPDQPLYSSTMDTKQPMFINMPSKETSDLNTTIGAAVTSPECTNSKKDDDSANPILKVNKRRVRCPECQRYTAETEEKMLRHIRKVHRGENPFQCSMCDYSTYNKSIFEEHVRIHQGIKPFKCNHCPYRSASKKNAKKHELIHRPDNPLKCDKCGFIARHYKSLKHHKSSKCDNNSNSEETPLVIAESKGDKGKKKNCGSCNKIFSTNVLYKSHLERCPKCGKALCPRSIKRHIRSIHSEKGDNSKPIKSVKKEFSCALCEWKGNVKARILLHLIHHPGQEVDDSVVDVQVLRDFGIMQ